MKVRVILASLFLFLIIIHSPSAVCEARDKDANVVVGVFVRSVEKVDLAESTFRMDFYLMFEFETSEASLEEVKQFEFVNGQPSVRLIEENIQESRTELVYRVKGGFVTPFELGKYPFDRHNIEVFLEFPFGTSNFNLEAFPLVNEEMIIVGWDYEGIESRVVEHSYEGENYLSRYILSIKIRRPLLSTILKNIMPITVIAAIALLTFLISASSPSERIALGVSTLLSATAFHLSLLGNIPPTGAFTIADGIMLSVYLIHFYSLLISVYLMRMKDRNAQLRAEKVNRKAILFLPVIIVVPIAIAVILNL
jgi:hypothetical protein